jgi:hypothetical protein
MQTRYPQLLHTVHFIFSPYDVSTSSIEHFILNRHDRTEHAQHTRPFNSKKCSVLSVTISSRLKLSDRLRIPFSHHSRFLRVLQFFFLQLSRLLHKRVQSHNCWRHRLLMAGSVLQADIPGHYFARHIAA